MKLSKMQQLILIELFLFILLFGAYTGHHTKDASDILSTSSNEVYRLISEEENISSNSENKDYIKWVDFKVTKEAMQDAYEYDVTTYGQETHLDWISLLAYQACKNGGDFSHYRSGDISFIAKKLLAKETTLESLTKDLKYYSYYYEAYDAVLGGLVGEYEVPDTSETPSDNTVSEDDAVSSKATAAKKKISAKKDSHIVWKKKYGLKGFLPLAKNFPYSDYDDFGVSRSYGYKRQHLGHDMVGQTGTPIIAVESGYVEAIGWNQYGGWRLGIRSFDRKRYYYYAHLRQNFPYCKSLTEGSVVTAGDVIGYLGHTGYSTKENVNNIDIPHLHFGLQLIFDESQKEGNNEIWVSCYELTRFLYQNQSETVKDEKTKEWHRITEMRDPAVKEWKKAHKN
ncbi:M23 family metallopeptidase [Roseburia sp. MSJ-14]|uniref:M23 family metallopeptidase n=1 Tax=Roseburia sp. MSJ-14 TaxID=2841514 RepID=UPI001C11B20E|nr:M23 family metallopeptidase [Roseburia sp. MSJ-14]MBU5474946.1 M23 family metallopeptidase [Roseburia sp. MSJ-14]